MWVGNCSGCSAAYNYEAAHRLFENTPLPKATRRGTQVWYDDQRPLDDKRKHHYRVERGPNGDYYDMVLYRTVMARYYKPAADGARRVLYSADPRQLSSQFMWRIVGSRSCKQVTTTEGVKVASPLYDHCTVQDPWVQVYDGTKFSAALWFDAEGRLDVSKYAHTPHQKVVASDEDKARRKAFKEKFANLLFMAVLRMPEFEREAYIDYYVGGPFRGATIKWDARKGLEQLCNPGFDLSQATSAQTDAFFEVCQSVYNTLASKRGYAQSCEASTGSWRYASRSGMPTDISQLKAPITPEDFQRSVLAKLVSMGEVNAKTGKVLLPQFMEWDKYPASSAVAVY